MNDNFQKIENLKDILDLNTLKVTIYFLQILICCFEK